METHPLERWRLTLEPWRLTSGDMETHHRAIKAYPQALETNPEAKYAHPETIMVHPGKRKAHRSVSYPGKGECADPVNEDAILEEKGGGESPGRDKERQLASDTGGGKT